MMGTQDEAFWVVGIHPERDPTQRPRKWTTRVDNELQEQPLELALAQHLDDRGSSGIASILASIASKHIGRGCRRRLVAVRCSRRALAGSELPYTDIKVQRMSLIYINVSSIIVVINPWRRKTQ